MNRFFLMLSFCALIFSACNDDGFTYAEIETDFGTMKVKLYNSTPKHRDNFVKLANEGFYDDLLFHRVINGFMVQGGDPDSRGAGQEVRLGGGGPGYQTDAEIGALHIKGALAAARTPNPEKKSSGSQFYIVHGNPQSDSQLDAIERQKNVKYSPEQRELYKTLGGRPDLDNEYTVFGEVVAGMEVIDKIAAVKTAPGDRPVEDVKMKVRILN
jgi:cyclophilin family peptidyl-prolyl cis-trans isomerase